MSSVSSPVVQHRIVPGAPPPPPSSKSQKKKRKTPAKSADGDHVDVPDTPAASQIEMAPSSEDIKAGSVANQLLSQPEEIPEATTPILDGANKNSPLAEMVSKRMKATNKKILRIQSYSTNPPEKLNDDQKRTLKTLPVLEGIYKELEEVKKAIEQHEAEDNREIALKEAQAAQAEQQRIDDAVAAAEQSHHIKTRDLLTFFRLHSALTAAHPSATGLGLSESEGLAVYSVTETLLGEDADSKTEVVRSFISGEGEIQGVSYSRLVEITQLYVNPAATETPESVEESIEQSEESAPTPEITVGGLPPSLATSGSFHFMQEDELEANPELSQSATEQQEWVQIESDAALPEVEVTETIAEVEVNGHTVVQDTVTVTTTTEYSKEGAINWADEEDGGLPSIAGLQAKFGTPDGTLTPSPPTPAPQTPQPHMEQLNNGPTVDDDGFVSAQRARGSRGRRGFRGGDRGGFRGNFRGDRGAYRGGDRGVFRGGDRGGERGESRGDRGEFRGDRGEFRGGDRGSFRGGERGGYRGGRSNGDWRGGDDGEHRGRGRGRGRAGLVDPEGTLVDPRTFLGYTTQQLYYKVIDDPFPTVMTTSIVPPSSSSSSSMVASTTSAIVGVPTPSQVIQAVPAPQAIEKPKKPTFIQSLDPQIASYFIAGGCAGAVSRTVVSPLERLKIIQQVQPTSSSRQYRGVWSSLARMWREEGFKGFMRGNGINCLRIIPYSAVQFTTYEQLKKWFTGYGATPLDTATRLSSGALAGITSVSSAAVPNAQLAVAATFSKAELTMWGMTLKVMREEGGVRALYRGLIPTAMGVAPYVGLNFAAYETLRGIITPPGKSSVARKLSCGALAGSISQTITYPFDVLRRKMQVTGMNSLGVKYNGALDALQSIVRTEGVKGLYRGLWPNLLKVAPSIATSFFTYELVKEFLGAT
ncbi:hypothetical protein EUX98_g3250 [Antrodiella citrinella]|uniref:Uncharacterized protein n=1 Tax=Antrodiella citrinella TaxID=2447956 RepID=A0A4S4MWZ9_9APHY|nr:hypothetical protein EUX98_g3250 [Antrodiella citrinella]